MTLPDHSRDETVYAILPARLVHPAFLEACGHTLQAAAADLGLPRVELAFIYGPPESLTERLRNVVDWVIAPGERVGAFTTPEIPFRVHLHPLWEPTVATLLHELFHLHQQMQGTIDEDEASPARAALEAAADEYAADAIVRLGLSEIPDTMPRLRGHA